MSLASPRSLFFLAFLACVVMMGSALYLEHVVGLEPCPLCIVQRLCVIVFGVFALLATLHNPGRGGRRVYSTLTFLAAAAGGAAAVRQIWLQNTPPDPMASCMPTNFDYMLQALPFEKFVAWVLHGTADCAEVTWTLFGMSLAEWCLLAFISMAIFSLYQFLRRA
ncbi:disulfide bond formation protein B [Pseudomonas turukhanskensis]|uniref:Disulfide bond formation protein B n=1 Tax=Pseudomonas turukhanskensis TaxID=1806536 RepID=A0A9W6K2G1_9PSED|nr:disulfide bond formation protein B [Pseudomonas turukhanskensis]GLK87572.1 disulfide bond formation protein B 1 [Pseudomonas turukhanskensis]